MPARFSAGCSRRITSPCPIGSHFRHDSVATNRGGTLAGRVTLNVLVAVIRPLIMCHSGHLIPPVVMLCRQRNHFLSSLRSLVIPSNQPFSLPFLTWPVWQQQTAQSHHSSDDWLTVTTQDPERHSPCSHPTYPCCGVASQRHNQTDSSGDGLSPYAAAAHPPLIIARWEN